MNKSKPTAMQLAKAIEMRTALELNLATSRQRPRVLKQRLHELNGISELAYWLRLYALEKKIDAHRAVLLKILKRL
jgi:hypothetical protein